MAEILQTRIDNTSHPCSKALKFEGKTDTSVSVSSIFADDSSDARSTVSSDEDTLSEPTSSEEPVVQAAANPAVEGSENPEAPSNIPRQQRHTPDTLDIRSYPLQQPKEVVDRPLPNHLIVSPYCDIHHHLNLSTLPLQARNFALALTHLTPTTPSYATTPYTSAFNWPSVFSVLRTLSTNPETRQTTFTAQTFYVVEFRSRLLPNIDNALLFKLDQESHREATASGGLLKYWFGEVDVERRNLATCLWTTKEAAIAGGKGPWHRQARAVVPRMYESIDVHGLVLHVADGVENWWFEEYRIH